MSRRIVECVPNISEGRNRSVIDAVVKAAAVKGATVLDVDPGAATNRTVITIAGEPEAVMESAFRLIEKAGQLIDMRAQQGAHPRHGATDVCPFVPVSGLSMDDCVNMARRLGERVGRELGIPVYLYEYASFRDNLRKLPDIRAGEYEALKDKLGREEWKPDFGPNRWDDSVARTGVCTIGARNFLIAYNVNVNSRDTSIAREVALTIRDSGRPARTRDWKFARDGKGAKIHTRGRLECCKATGWYIEEYGTSQVTMNLTDISVTPLHTAFEVTREEVGKLGGVVTGSEIVGLVPLSSMLEAGRFYLEKQNEGLSGVGKQAVTTGLPEKDLVEIAVRSMGLREVAPFEPREKIIEYMVRDDSVNLSGSTCRDFCDQLSTDSPAPGGGSAAALAGALASALVSMVANLTVKNRNYRESWSEMRRIAPRAQEIKENLLSAIDDDTRAFNGWMEAARSGGDVQSAVREAVEVPLRVLGLSLETAVMADAVAERGMQASVSDAGVAASAARTAAEGACLNVLINLGEVDDPDYRDRVKAEALGLLEETVKASSGTLAKVMASLEKGRAPMEEQE
jgi:glutamate formiminotransferase/formiminotetrahydrofolate cyclodeaminase